MWFELMPAYGRDYKSAKEVKAAWLADKDFEGDYQLRFLKCNRSDLLKAYPGGFSVVLRYKRNTQLTTVTEKPVSV